MLAYAFSTELPGAAAMPDWRKVYIPQEKLTDYDGNLLTSTGRPIRLRTVWIVEGSDPRARFVTAYPSKEPMDTPKELDVVVLRRALEEYGLKEGDVGAVVHVYEGGSA